MKSIRWFVIRAAIPGIALVAFGLTPVPAQAVGFPTTTSLELSQDPSPACSDVTFKATVFGALFPDSPEGFVQFVDGASFMGTPRPITPDFDEFLGQHVVPTNHSSATITVRLSGGSHVITVDYVGTDAPSLGGPLVQTITAATSTTVVTSAVNPSVFGQPVPLTAAVSSACSGSIGGSVQFVADGADLGAPQPVDGSGHATVTATDLAVGTHPVSAVFSSSSPDVTGSTGFLISGGFLIVGQVVDPADTTTTVSSSANPSEFGANVTFTAAVSVDPPGAGTAIGIVQFQDNGADLGAPKTLDGSGHASITTSGLSVGNHVVSAIYSSGSADFNGSSGTENQTVERAPTSLHYDGTSSADYHDEADLSARLVRTDDGTPIAGKTITFAMGAEGCHQTTGVDGEAACTITPNEAAGPFTVSAGFAGDGDYAPSTDSRPFTVTREESTTVYSGPTVIAQGQPVALAGRLLEDGVSPIAGRSLTITIGSGPSAESCTTGPTDAGGRASCSVPSVTIGQGVEPVEAAFAGDGYYLPSSADATIIVFAFPSQGVFILGDGSAASAPSTATFWGAQWAKDNAVSGGAPSAFKGYADKLSATPPGCGGTWTSSPGNSSSPVGTVPHYMGTAVSDSITKKGSSIGGDIVSIVVVVTDPGYAPNPGHAGTGTVIATYC